MAKETIDIEKIVEWAYRVQHVDRYRGGVDDRPTMVSTTGSIGEFLRLGTRVDNSGAAARALGVRLPDDAGIIHDAVLALGDVYLEWRARDVVELWDHARLETAGMLIRHVDGVACLLPAYEPGGKAPAAPIAVELLSPAVMVILNGRTGSQPEWHPDWRPGTRATDGAPDRREVMHARAGYLAWHAALVSLAATLKGRLSDFEPVAPAAPVAPWKAHVPRIVDDLAAGRRMIEKSRERRRRRA